ncbi:hypothetical protein UFOVP1193_74 [uncultured Caudovirales phage]|uniref:Uncharacterized protein n=1 Tax=uncultured Caudovirales phage TaxID=2100421 RepID=A0A6J5R7K2_9CAUD|nr:hypothetical protein UFOVP1193_74 [uncultured Caudovirales phage]
MKKSAKANALKDMMGRAMAARAGRGAMAAPAAPMGMGMKKGGSFRSSANGIASKGKTKAKQVKMARGGMRGC